ncbi:MAG: DNA (cytosine-5-)-methyltransferase, partial [Streptococcus sp.]
FIVTNRVVWNAIDLFAGIGGIRLGFERAFGEELITTFSSEIDKAAQETYLANFPNSNLFGDINDSNIKKQIPQFDICLAGFPCQAFSNAGKRLGFQDIHNGSRRGLLFFQIIEICSKHKPPVIFCENVKALTRHDGGYTFAVMCHLFKISGYKVVWKVLDSADFGVPQHRERSYIVAFRKDLDSSGFYFPEATNSSTTLRDIIEREAVPTKYYLSVNYLNTLIRHKAHHERLNHGFGYVIRSWDEKAGTLVCGNMGRERNLIIDPRQKDLTRPLHFRSEVNREGIRKLTPRECARLQGFPEQFALHRTECQSYKQLGNTVTVPVIEAIARNIKKVLDENYSKGNLEPLAIS